MKKILCINGSDSLGDSGIQADIRTIKDLGGQAITVVTSVTVQNSKGIADIHELPAELVVGQLRASYEERHPDVVKIGLVNSAATIEGIRNEIVGCRCVVCSPVILSSYGGLLMSNEAIQAFSTHLLPLCKLLILKCTDAEILLGQRISTDADMQQAAEHLHAMGAEWVLLRGGTYREGRINALLSPSQTFFSSVNIEGWQRHGVGGTLSTAIASRLSQGDDVPQAVVQAHAYMHSQVVYASAKPQSLQLHALYDRFMSLLTERYASLHDVASYARELSISTRYLSQITHAVCGNTPKEIIDEQLIKASEQLLSTTTLTVQQISYRLGFPTQVAFAKFFKAKKGCSPSSYRSNIV